MWGLTVDDGNPLIFFIKKHAFMFCATPLLIWYENVSSLLVMSLRNNNSGYFVEKHLLVC